MDDQTFDFRPSDVAAGSERFPARRLRPHPHTSRSDATSAVRDRGSEFARHAWDESGHL